MAPILEVSNGISALSNSPTVQPRSKILTISINVAFNCSLDFSVKSVWKAAQMVNGSYAPFSLNSNSLQLVVQANTLPYGLYKFNFEVNLTSSLGDIHSSSIDSFVEIVPSGLVVNSFDGGASYIEIGYAQSLLIAPSEYSFDLDSIADMNALNFEFFCSKNIFGSLIQSSQDLSLSSGICFDSSSKFFSF